MKIVSGALAAVLLAGMGWMAPAHAQGVPPGSYMRSCANAAMQGDSLVATCRRVDGREQRSILGGVRRCIGDIGNNNGTLQCSVAGGGMARGQVMARPGAGPGAGPPPGPPPYGAPPSGWERDRWERCHELHERTERLRARLDREFDPLDRARLERRLHELQEREERCR